MRIIDPDQALQRVAPVDPRRRTLHELLDEAQRFAPEYGPSLASHLPMALAALYELGAEPAQMRRYFAHDSANLLPLAPSTADDVAVVDDDWPALRGRLDAFPALRAHFARGLARDGRDAVLRAALPRLLPGIAGVAFHGAIRTAHAVDAHHDGELASALAYWAARWTVFPTPAATRATFATPAAWLDALDAHLLAHDALWRPQGRLITIKMQQAAATGTYLALAGAAGGFQGGLVDVLDGLAFAAATRYAATRNFTVLHIATTARALRVLSLWLAPGAEIPATVWHSVAAASLASGVAFTPGSTTAANPAEALDWADVRRLACDSNDDHVIKLVHAMTQQQARAPAGVWLAAAAAAVRE